jgi:hypothetical protein
VIYAGKGEELAKKKIEAKSEKFRAPVRHEERERIKK